MNDTEKYIKILEELDLSYNCGTAQIVSKPLSFERGKEIERYFNQYLIETKQYLEMVKSGKLEQMQKENLARMGIIE